MIDLGLGVGRPAAPRRTLAPWQKPPAPFAATTVYDFAAGLQSWTRSSTAAPSPSTRLSATAARRRA